MIIHGIQIMEGMGENNWKMAKIIGLPVIKPFENAKIKITGSGFVPKTDTQGKSVFLAVDVDYAEKLVSTTAFVPNKDYQVVTGLDEETFETIVVELVPTEPSLKKHFDEMLKD